MSSNASRANQTNQPRPMLNPSTSARSHSHPGPSHRSEVPIQRGWGPSSSGSSSGLNPQGRRGYQAAATQPQSDYSLDRWLNQRDVEGPYHGIQAVVVERSGKVKDGKGGSKVRGTY